MDPQVQIQENGEGLVLVHFLFSSPAGVARHEGEPLTDTPVEETWKIACVPNLVEMHAFAGRAHPWQRSNEVRAVTCPQCQKTREFQKAQAELHRGLASKG